MTPCFPSLPTADMQCPALWPPQLSLSSQPLALPSVNCVAPGHDPDPLRGSWVMRGQHQEETFTGGPGDPMASWLQLPRDMAGMSVTCQGLHQSGASGVGCPCHGPR